MRAEKTRRPRDGRSSWEARAEAARAAGGTRRSGGRGHPARASGHRRADRSNGPDVCDGSDDGGACRRGEGALTELVVQLLLDASKPPPAPVAEPTAAEAAAEAEARAAAVAEAELGMVARRVAVDAKAAAEEAARREAAEAERRAVEAAARAEAGRRHARGGDGGGGGDASSRGGGGGDQGGGGGEGGGGRRGGGVAAGGREGGGGGGPGGGDGGGDGGGGGESSRGLQPPTTRRRRRGPLRTPRLRPCTPRLSPSGGGTRDQAPERSGHGGGGAGEVDARTSLATPRALLAANGRSDAWNGWAERRCRGARREGRVTAATGAALAAAGGSDLRRCVDCGAARGSNLAVTAEGARCSLRGRRRGESRAGPSTTCPPATWRTGAAGG